MQMDRALYPIECKLSLASSLNLKPSFLQSANPPFKSFQHITSLLRPHVAQDGLEADEG